MYVCVCVCVRAHSGYARLLTFGPCADLYAILKTTEKLERAYVRDAVTAKDYELQCSKLIGQYKTLWETLRGQVRAQALSALGSPMPQASYIRAAQIGDLQDFTREYNLQCPMATQRLVFSGMPATVEHGKPRHAK